MIRQRLTREDLLALPQQYFWDPVPDWTDGKGCWSWGEPDGMEQALVTRYNDGKGWLYEFWSLDADNEDVDEDWFFYYVGQFGTPDGADYAQILNAGMVLVDTYGCEDVVSGNRRPRIPKERFFRPREVLDPFTGELLWFTSRPDLWAPFAEKQGARVVQVDEERPR